MLLFCITFSLLFWKYKSEIKENNDDYLKYEKIIKEINFQKPKNLYKAEVFIIKNKNIYGTLTSMFLSKKYVLNKNFNKAFIQLQNALEYTHEENLKNILKIRMVKIKIQQKEYEEANNILKNIKDKNWESIIKNIKGDIWLKKKNKKNAIKYWNQSLKTETSNASKETIKMKINELK